METAFAESRRYRVAVWAAAVCAACQPAVQRPAAQVAAGSGTIEVGFAERDLVDAANFDTLFERFDDVAPVTTYVDGQGVTHTVSGDGLFEGCPDQPRGPAGGKPWCLEPFHDTNGNGWFDGAFLAGFDSSRPAQGVLDPIQVEAWVLRVGGVVAAFATVDAVGYHYSEVEKIAADLRNRGLHVDALVVSATHSHEAPDLMGQWGPDASADVPVPVTTGALPTYLAHVRRQVADAVADAADRLAPATLCDAKADSSINPLWRAWPDADWRRAYREAGATADYPQSPGGIAYSIEGLENDWRDPFVINHDVNVMQFRRSDDSVVGTIVNTHSHPESLWSRNRLASADFPGYVRIRLRQRFPGSKAVSVSGSVGGIIGPHDVPVWLRTADGAKVTAVRPQHAADGTTLATTAVFPVVATDSTPDKTRSIGYAYADLAADALTSAACFDRAAIRAAEREFLMPLYNPAFLFAGFLHLFPRTIYDAAGRQVTAIRGDVVQAFAGYPDRPLGFVKTKITAVRLLLGDHDALTILTAPGEMFPEQVLGLPADVDDAAQVHRYWPQGREKHGAHPQLQFTLRDLFLKQGDSGRHERYLLYGLGNDELGYLVPQYDFIRYHPLLDKEPPDHYEESNSLGPDDESTLNRYYRALAGLLHGG